MAAMQADFMVELFGEDTVVRRRTMQVTRYSPDILARYRGLADIDPREYKSYFPKNGRPWSASDTKYLLEWWGKDDVLSLSYALGRPPWGLQRQICKLRRHGIQGIPYLREQHV
jgi:hypothetical protein